VYVAQPRRQVRRRHQLRRAPGTGCRAVLGC
jgi:hypothetical protein